MMESFPKYSLTTFHEFLRFRRVSVEPRKKQANESSISQHYSRRNSLLFRVQAQINAPSSESSEEPSNGDLDFESRFMTSDLNPLTSSRRITVSPDFFYNPSQDTGEGYRYFGPKDVLGDRRYSNNTETTSRCAEKIFLECIRENKAAKEIWEQNDDLTFSETAIVALYDTDDPDTNNGGVYNPYRPELYSVSKKESTYLTEIPPADKFRDSLELYGKDAFHLDEIENSRKGKGNLSCLITGGNGPDILAVACVSEILIYEFDETSNGLKDHPSMKFETRPDFTTNDHVRNSTWPYYPHTINTLKSSSNWVNGPVLAACLDDGRILIWDKSKILDALKKNKSKAVNKVEATYQVEVKASAWGIDFKSNYNTSEGEHNIFCVSANTETITLFYLHKSTGRFTSVESHKLSHNIPEVTFISYQIRDGEHLALLSCTSIQAELVVFKVAFIVNIYNERSRTEHVVSFQPPVVVRRTELNGDGWTSKPIHARYFKKVQSLRALTGDPNINEVNEAANILCESKILAPQSTSKSCQSFGIASYWQYFEPHMVNLSVTPPGQDAHPKTQCVNEEHQRIHQAYKLLCTRDEEKDLMSKGLDDEFLLVSSEKNLYLYRADTLFCAAATRSPFTLKLPLDEEYEWCDRISITCAIPELSCFIAVTQIGFVTIMRLCEHRGVYGMRQEHLFPNPLNFNNNEDRQRTVIGLSVRDLSVSAENPRFFLYLIHSDGFTLTYELRMRADFELEIMEI